MTQFVNYIITQTTFVHVGFMPAYFSRLKIEFFLCYFFQFKISQSTMSIQQQQQMKYMGLISPVMIIFISLSAPAALPLYWVFGGIFLIFQTYLGRKLYQTPKQVTDSKTQKG